MPSRFLILAAALCAGLLSAPLARAEAAKAAAMPPAVVAIVDVQRILQESLAAKDVQQQLEAQRAKFQQQISEEEKRLATAENTLKRDREKLTDDAYAVREQQLRRQFLEVERDVQSRRRALDQGFNESMGAVRTSLLSIVPKLAAERGANLVVLKQQALWFDDRLDITDEVLNRLNTKLKTVPVMIKPVESTFDKEKPKDN
ncbi:MAG: hypothetical protein GC131_07480 [Alphaproteobacteria bacterium]|nr:hypothetical protein [Alphaproteobacteria bacterium]